MCMRRLSGCFSVFSFAMYPPRFVPDPARSPYQHRQRHPHGLHQDPMLAPMQFESVTLAQFEPTAEGHVEEFLRRQPRDGSAASILLLNVPKTTLKRAVLRFRVGARDVTAVGQSTRAKRARALCCMHAVRLMDHYAVGDIPDHAAAPLPLAESTNTFAHSTAPTQTRTASNARRGSTSPRPPESPQHWGEYVHQCEGYIHSTEEAMRRRSLSSLRVPPSGNALVDRATESVERQGLLNPHALQQLNNTVRGAGASIAVERVSSRVFVSTLVIDPNARLTAMGVAANARDAKRQCATHALEIFRLLQEQANEQVKPSNNANGSGGDNNTHSVSPEAMTMSLTPRQARLLGFLSLLFNASPSATFTRDGAHRCCCVELCGIVCTGRGINRFESERNAITAALGELELCDERLQALNTLMARYPSLEPACIPTAQLPESLRAEIHAFAEPFQAKTNSTTDSSSISVLLYPPNSTLCGDASPMNENREVAGGVDAEVQATVDALTAAGNSDTTDVVYAAQMRDQLCSLRADPHYLNRFHSRRSSLAITTVADRLLTELDNHRVVVVSGTTGCGKTTQVPQFILDHEIMKGCGDQCSVLVTQPRRLSAMSVAERIASERLSAVGGDVGYTVRLDARPGRHITLCTSGVLLQMLVGMPSLSAVSHLIIDEVHERDINCDVVLALVRQILAGPNKKLRVILMSATLRAEMFATYFDNAPVISVEGATYPVTVRYLDDVARLLQASTNRNDRNGYFSRMFEVLETTGQRGNKSNSIAAARRLVQVPPKTDYGLIARLIDHCVSVDLNNNTVGRSVLVFLPGWKELVSARQAIDNLRSGRRYHIVLLHSSIDASRQRECFAPPPAGYIKVVLATNIAESGITIDDAAVVIDTGHIKQTSWVSRNNSNNNSNQYNGVGSTSGAEEDTTSYATQLSLTFASRANCTQRKGRAGRTQGGVCYRLFTREVWDALPSYQEAEIHRVPLTQVILKLLSLGHNDPRETLRTFMEPPSPRNVEVSMRKLRSLGAVTAEERLTPLGLYLSRLPCDPHIGKMIMMGAVLHCLDSALTMAATADISPFPASREVAFDVRQRRHALAMESQSDHISVLNAYNALCARSGGCDGDMDVHFARENFLHLGNIRLISRYKRQYCDILRRSGFIRARDLLDHKAWNSYSDRNARNNPDEGEDEDNINNSEDSTADDISFSNVNSRGLYTDVGPLSRDAADVALVKACLCSALFPHVAVLDPTPLLQERRPKKLVLRTATRQRIAPSKDSACRRLGPPRAHGVQTVKEFLHETSNDAADIAPSMFYMYENVFGVKEAREEFLTQVSSVSLWAMLLFGVGEADMTFDAQLGLCIVAGWIGIHIDADSFAALQALRTALHHCVWRKYISPTDEANNRALEELRRLCKEVLTSPPNTREQHINRLVDTGRILSPISAETIENNPNLIAEDGE